MDYETDIQDKWLEPTQKGFKLACCDCGLVHDIDFRVKNGKAQINFRNRDNKETKILRKKKGFHPEIISMIMETNEKQTEGRA